MNLNSINFKEKLAEFNEQWSPKVVAEMNDYQFKLVKIKGEFVWHDHQDTDETFLVLKGEMEIELKSGTVNLSEGEMYVVPKCLQHKPHAVEECHILVIEPKGIVNTGKSGGDLTAKNDVWV